MEFKKVHCRKRSPKFNGATQSKRRNLALKTQLPEVYKKILMEVLQQSSTGAYGDRFCGLLRSGRYDLLYRESGLLSTEVYDSAAEHFAANQICYLIKKYPWGKLIPGLDPQSKAVEKFDEAEALCKKTNLRFSRRLSLQRSRFFPLIEEMKRWIASCLGETPSFAAISDRSGHGTGANLGVHGNATNLFRKYTAERFTCTRGALPYVISSLWNDFSFRLYLLKEYQERDIVCYCFDDFVKALEERIDLVDCNKVSFVPKTAETHRAIAVEPLLNGYVQRGVDSLMREKLKRKGVDLRTQEKNRSLARQGSIDGSFSTIDLSSASDTISKQLVYYLLPLDWFRVLNDLRSPCFIKKGDVGVYQKFSSMGNNFTFPLETLIFKAAMVAAQKATATDRCDSAVYGDDIIVNPRAAAVLLPLLRFLGFTPNREKTFVSGPFRESCGSDWYLGQDVRPVVLDHALRDTGELMVFHNACQRSERALEFFKSSLPLIRESVPDRERLLRPPQGQHRISDSGYALSLLAQKCLNGAFTVPLDIFMGSRNARWDRRYQCWDWKEFLFQADYDDIDPSLSSLRANQEALYQSFLSGVLEGKPCLRYSTTRRARYLLKE